MEIIEHNRHDGYSSSLISDHNIHSILSDQPGILYSLKDAGNEIKEGDLLAKILDPFTGKVLSEIISPISGTLFFAHQKPLIHQHTVLYKIISF